MMPAAKHFDLIMGIDMHVTTVPPSPVPAPYYVFNAGYAGP
jgi:hypothetical protein